MKLPRALLHLCWLSPLVVVLVYFINPFDVPSADPRGRLLGVVPYTLPASDPGGGGIVLACTWAYRHATPARGDLIVFRPPHAPDSPYAKRVVGLGGELVEFVEGSLRIDGVAVEEPYVVARYDPGRVEAWAVPDGHVFVAGDDRPRSMDSRHFGPVPQADVIGRICHQ